MSQVADTFGAPRGGGRDHQGQDIFAPRGTPVRSATSGIVFGVSDRFTGGRGEMILRPGGARYFYTHLDAYADGLYEGMAVSSDTVIGFVGNDGNAGTRAARALPLPRLVCSTCRPLGLRPHDPRSPREAAERVA